MARLEDAPVRDILPITRNHVDVREAPAWHKWLNAVAAAINSLRARLDTLESELPVTLVISGTEYSGTQTVSATGIRIEVVPGVTE